MATCINLKRQFGERYKVAYEESYAAEHGEHGRAEDPWLMIVLCQNGHICPWGGSNLAACTNTAGAVSKRLRALPFVEVVQDASDGINATFDVKHFDEVAAIMKPRRRRRQTEAQKQVSVERLRKFQWTKDNLPDSPARQAANQDLSREFGGPSA